MRLFLFPAVCSAISFGLANPADAAIVWFADQNIAIPTTPDGVSVNLETGAFANNNDLADADANFFFGGAGIANDADSIGTVPTWQPVRVAPSPPSFDQAIANLVVGTEISTASNFAAGFGGSGDPNTHLPSPFAEGESGYLGFSLEHSAFGTLFGWMRVTLNSNNADGTIHEWAFRDGGGPIQVGVIPEPQIGLLLVLSVFLFTVRKRKRS